MTPSPFYLTLPYSQGIRGCLKLLTGPGTGTRPGVMIPIPQYPLYSASLAEYNMEQVIRMVLLVIMCIISSSGWVGYYLDESSNRALDVAELGRTYQSVKDKSDIKAIMVTTPGSIIGQVLTKQNLEAVIYKS